jgi:hypothetical protein
MEAAQAHGISPVDWIAASLPKGQSALPPGERESAHARLRQHIVSLGHATGADNASIDADLAVYPS